MGEVIATGRKSDALEPQSGQDRPGAVRLLPAAMKGKGKMSEPVKTEREAMEEYEAAKRQALNVTLKVLRPLVDDDRFRVLAAVAEFYGDSIGRRQH